MKKINYVIYIKVIIYKYLISMNKRVLEKYRKYLKGYNSFTENHSVELISKFYTERRTDPQTWCMNFEVKESK